MKRCAYHKPFGWRQDTTPRHPEKTSIRLSLFRMFMWKPRTQTPTCWVRKIEISLGLGWWNSAKNHVSKKEVLHRKCQAKQIRGHSKATFKLVIFLGGGVNFLDLMDNEWHWHNLHLTIWGNQGWEYIVFCRWQSSAPLESVHQPLSSATLLESSSMISLSRMLLSSVWLRTRGNDLMNLHVPKL